MMVANFRKRFWVSFVLTIPLAAGILYQIGFLLPSVVGALVMSISTVIMAVNA